MYRLLYSTFINKVIRFVYISYFLSTEVFSLKIRFLKDIVLRLIQFDIYLLYFTLFNKTRFIQVIEQIMIYV
jgi:hypothetical protein